MIVAMRIVLLVLLCWAIVRGDDDTVNEIPDDTVNEIPNDAEEDRGTGPGDQSFGNKTIEAMFKEAVQAYLEENWDGCVEGFERAFYGHRLYKRMVINCRQKCRAKAAGSSPFYPENIEDLHFYERKVKETLCLLMCNQDYREITGPGALNRPSKETEQNMYNHKFYDYVHHCYFQKKRYQDAANAVFTFLVRHSNHEPSIAALKHYLTLPGVSESDVVNLEAAPYLQLYFKGVAAYEQEDYKEAAGLFETSLRSFIESEEECRIYCEGPFDQGWLPEFTASVANHFAYCLKCKRSCTHVLNDVNGDYRADMLRSHYDYLQFSYYKLGKLKAACQAVESFLLFAPMDETMTQNKEYYSKQPRVEDNYFTARDEALSYVKRQEYEMNLLRYISTEFLAVDARFERYTKEMLDGKKHEKKKGKKKQKKDETTDQLGKVTKEMA